MDALDRLIIRQNPGGFKAKVSVRAIDSCAATSYLRDVEALAREGRTSDDPRVLCGALDVLAHQPTAAPPIPEPGREPFNPSPEDMDEAWGER
jgi:hypothetical protein